MSLTTSAQQPPNVDMTSTVLLTVKQAGEMLGVGYFNILKKLARKELRGYYEGAGWRIPMWAIREYQERKMVESDARRTRNVERARIFFKGMNPGATA